MSDSYNVNKVIYNSNTLIDLTSDTVDAAHLAEGYTAHDLTGAAITGTMAGGTGSDSNLGMIMYYPNAGTTSWATWPISITGTALIRHQYTSSSQLYYTESEYTNPSSLNAYFGNDALNMYYVDGTGQFTGVMPSSSGYYLRMISLPFIKTIPGSCFYNQQNLTIAEFPNVETIGSQAFKYCSKLRHIELPSIKIISNQAFENCWLSEVVLGPSLTSIGQYAFGGQTQASLSKVVFKGTTPPTFGVDCFYGATDCVMHVPKGTVNAYRNAPNAPTDVQWVEDN